MDYIREVPGGCQVDKRSDAPVLIQDAPPDMTFLVQVRLWSHGLPSQERDAAGVQGVAFHSKVYAVRAEVRESLFY